MSHKHVAARRGGLQSHRSRSQDRIQADATLSDTCVADTPVSEHATECHSRPRTSPVNPPLHQRSTTSSSSQQQRQHIEPPSSHQRHVELPSSQLHMGSSSLQQQHIEPPSLQQHTGSSSSSLQHGITTHAEDVIRQQQQNDLVDDPPSGGDLPNAYWGPPDTPLVEDEPLDTELIDPGTRGKRGINKAPKANKRRELRVNVTLKADGSFVGKEANKVISHRMKYFFNPRYTSWEKAQKSHRQFLWKEFGMARRWDPEINEQVARQWNLVHGVKYRNMMGQAKSLSDDGFRSDWMQVRHYWICKRYWDSPEFKNLSQQNQKNRGVEFDEDGKALKAMPTHMGGQKGISERGDTLDAYVETKKKVKPKIGEGSLTEGNNECLEGESLSINSNSEQDEWINDQPRITIEKYRKILDEKYADKPEERPSDSDPRDPIAWALAVGGAKRGRVRGVSELANPSGRVLSRVSSDQFNVDNLIPLFLSITIMMYFSLLGILVITCQYAWPTVFMVIPLIWLNIWYQGYYLASSRELTRLDQITKAPIIHHFSETISGVMTIRCFKKEDTFFHGNVDKVNSNLRMSFHNNASNEWLGFRLEMIGTFLLCISTVLLIMLPSSIIRPEYVGLSLSYGLPLNAILYYTIYLGTFLENRMVSVERIKQFINITSEASWMKSDSPASADWPNCGNIEIKELQVRYRQNTPLVLKGISLIINGGEKIGVVGRTGSGKSTLIQVFFRLVEPYSGSIIVDGIDICKLGLHDLRSRFGIIPQEPVLFEGTVRSNIDPLSLYSDDAIWRSLEHCQLKDVVMAKPEKLDASVVDSGDNWSVGQRQLLCLGRVMLKRSKILFMDEATASVDAQTDAFIQKIIRQDFSNCTIITIAHRIPTVMDCDKVLAIEDGLANEFDSPSNLLARESLFGALVQEYAARSSSL